MDIVNQLRTHLIVATAILFGSVWLSRVLESGAVTTLAGLAGIGGFLFGSSVYVGLVFGVGTGLGILIVQDTIEEHLAELRMRRREVLRRTMGSESWRGSTRR